MSCDIREVVYAEWEHYEQRCSTSRAVPGVEFPVYDNAVDYKLYHCEVCDEYSQPQAFIEDDSADIERIGEYHIDNEGAEFVQRIFSVVLGFSKQADVVCSRESAGIYIFFEFMKGEDHEEQDHKSLQCRDGVGEDAEGECQCHEDYSADNRPVAHV